MTEREDITQYMDPYRPTWMTPLPDGAAGESVTVKTLVATVSPSAETCYYFNGEAYVTDTKDHAIENLTGRLQRASLAAGEMQQDLDTTVARALWLETQNQRLRVRVSELERLLAQSPRTFKHIEVKR